VVFFVTYTISFWLPENLTRLYAITAVVVYIGSDVLDIYTTMVNQRLIPDYAKRGLICSYYEANRLLPKQLTTRQIVLSIPTLISVIVLPFVWFVPAVGFAIGFGHLRASLSNRRWTSFLRAELAYFDQHGSLDE
jgi:hypothetical protein